MRKRYHLTNCFQHYSIQHPYEKWTSPAAVPICQAGCNFIRQL